MHELDPAAVAQLAHLDSLDPEDALALIARVRTATHQAAAEQMARARVLGRSWRSISLASGVNQSTVRRWASWGPPVAVRRRQGAL